MGHKNTEIYGWIGGRNTSDTRLRRCAWAWVVNRYRWGAPSSLVAHYGQRSTMRDMGPDSKTVPRAKLEAVYHALRVIDGATTIEDVNIYSDCKAVVDGFQKGRELTLMGDMGAVWYEVWKVHRRITSSGDRKVTGHKVKGHCSDPTIIPVTHQKGNGVAEFNAGMAVRNIPEKQAERILKKRQGTVGSP